jgi:GntR family transcriptional regulator / MocR family aminotransferase
LTSYWRERDPILPHCLRTFRHDFRLGTTDVTRFPLPIWRRLQARALYTLTRAPADYAAPEGRPALREAITRHVSFARAVACGPDDVVVTSGAQQAFDLLARILVTSGRTRVAVEDPGYPPLRAAFAAAHAEIVPIPIDDEGLAVDRLPVDVTVIAVTPSHQFPLGVAMSPHRRMELLAFANRRNAIIIEDDYDGEFRFSGRPVEALQTLDRAGSVFYVRTFSKCLLPALRLGYVVTPAWARRALVAAKQIADWHTPVVAQDTLAVFIAEGHLARHVRTMRRVYAERRMVLSEALTRHCMGRIELIPSIAGLHMSVRLIASRDSESVSAAVAELGLGIETLERYAIADRSWKGLAFGIGSIETTKIEEAVLLLAQQLD